MDDHTELECIANHERTIEHMKTVGTVFLLGLVVVIIILGLAKPGPPIGEKEQQLIEAASPNDLRSIPKLVQQKALLMYMMHKAALPYWSRYAPTILT